MGPFSGRNFCPLASTALIVATVILFRWLCDGSVFLPKCWPSCINSLDRCDCAYSYLVVRWARFFGRNFGKIASTSLLVAIVIILFLWCDVPVFVAEILANLHQQPRSLRLLFFFSCGAVGQFFGRHFGQLASTALLVAIVLLLLLWCDGPVFCRNVCQLASTALLVAIALVFSCGAMGPLFSRICCQLVSTELIVAIVVIIIILW
jgi:hypothetical protein